MSEQFKGFAQAIIDGIEEFGAETFRIHPKGTGVVCIDPSGIEPHVFVTEYLGELYPSYRWCERLDVVEQAQKQFELKPVLPDFYNILLERPRSDPRGYGTGSDPCYPILFSSEFLLLRTLLRRRLAKGELRQQLLALMRCKLHFCGCCSKWETSHRIDHGKCNTRA